MVSFLMRVNLHSGRKISTSSLVRLIVLLVIFPVHCLADNPAVMIKTSKGDIGVLLYADRSPDTVANFLSYVDSGAYEKNIFHRVISGFMIQTGGYFEDLTAAEAGEGLHNEADNGLSNTRGTLAMARMDAIDSADRQFFINVDDNGHLDHSETSCSRLDEQARQEARSRGLNKPQTCRSFGYAVFGEVISGMEVVDAIELVQTEFNKGFDDVPVEAISIESVERIEIPAGP
jgi:peptidyl-prolyl cis-trans isomerase A (cyclophilin A)